MKNLNRISTGLFWGIPTLGRPVHMEWALSFKGMNPPINFNVIHSIIRNTEIGVARNALAQAAIDADCKYLFFHGDDTVPPPHAVKQLIFRMENTPDCGVVGGVYCSKCDPPAPLVFNGNGKGSYWDWKIGEFFQCTGLGMDCTLIRTEVFKELSKPWFKTVDTDQYLDGVNGAEQWTEDLYFCNKILEETPWKIYCDASVICDHWDVYGDKVYRLRPDCLPSRQMVVDNNKPKVLIIGPKIEIENSGNYNIIHFSTDGDPSADYRGTTYQTPFENNSFDWVIVTEPQNNIGAMLLECRRLTSVRISINVHGSLSNDYLLKMHGGKFEGTFLELKVD